MKKNRMKTIAVAALIIAWIVDILQAGNMTASAASGWTLGGYVQIGESVYQMQTNEKIIYKTYKTSELSINAEALGAYAYQYFYTDSRIKSMDIYGEEHGITKTNIKKILKEMYGSAKATSKFIKQYSEGKKGAYYMFMGTGDFGDAGLSYFDRETEKLSYKGKYVVVTGKVKAYNMKKSIYQNKGIYTIKYLKKHSKEGIHRLVSISVKKM